MTMVVPAALGRGRDLVQPAMRSAVQRLDSDLLRRIAGYHLGWLGADGYPTQSSGGKAIRPALAVLSAEAGGGVAQDGVACAVAVELVHNFSLLHDDIMDRDVERRHRPTGWVVFGEGQAILAGNALLTAAFEVLLRDGSSGVRALPYLLDATQELIRGQSMDLALEGSDVELDTVLAMEADKTAALLSCSCAIGAVAAGASPTQVQALAAFGHELGMAFQIVDDILGITGDESVTGKSASSDVRTGKRSAPIVAALHSGTPAGDRLAEILAPGAPQSEDEVRLAVRLVEEAGGLDWAGTEADKRLAAGLQQLAGSDLAAGPAVELAAVARYIVGRDT